MLDEKRTDKIMVKVGVILSLFLSLITATYFITEKESFDMTLGHTIFPASILIFSNFSFFFLILVNNQGKGDNSEKKLEFLISMFFASLMIFLSLLLLSIQIIKDVRYNFEILNLIGFIPYLADLTCIVVSMYWLKFFYKSYKNCIKIEQTLKPGPV
jgi:hypothetical protein